MACGFEASELFTCCVCRQDFATEPPPQSKPDLRPVALPCGHSICMRCGIEGQKRTAGCPLRCTWRVSDLYSERRWPLAYHYMQDIAATRALLAISAKPNDGSVQKGAAGEDVAPKRLQRPELGGNLSQVVFVDSVDSGGCQVTLLLSDAGIATVQSIVGGRRILPPAQVATGDDDVEDLDSAGVPAFRHPASAQAELERDLHGTLLRNGAADYILTRAVLGQIADIAVRTIYGPDADTAVAPAALGHDSAALQATVLPPRAHAHAADAVSVKVYCLGAKAPLASILDIDRAHKRGLFQQVSAPSPSLKRKASALEAHTEASPGSDVAIIGGSTGGAAAAVKSRGKCLGPLTSDAAVGTCCTAEQQTSDAAVCPAGVRRQESTAAADEGATSSAVRALELTWSDSEPRRSKRQRRAPATLTP